MLKNIERVEYFRALGNSRNLTNRGSRVQFVNKNTGRHFMVLTVLFLGEDTKAWKKLRLTYRHLANGKN
jgi:hypothetical protein